MALYLNTYHSPSGFDGYAIVHNGSCNLIGFVAENTSASTRWIQVFDGYVQPSGGAVPLLSLKLAGLSQESFSDPADRGLRLSTGMVIATSTTGPTYTDPSETKSFFTVRWY
jgi:hypothetical protein